MCVSDGVSLVVEFHFLDWNSNLLKKEKLIVFQVWLICWGDCRVIFGVICRVYWGNLWVTSVVT